MPTKDYPAFNFLTSQNQSQALANTFAFESPASLEPRDSVLKPGCRKKGLSVSFSILELAKFLDPRL